MPESDEEIVMACVAANMYICYIHNLEDTMDASIVDLRYKMREVLKALKRRERIRILYHGKVKGEIVPVKGNRELKTKDHSLFGLCKGESGNPTELVAEMRRRRSGDL